MKNAGIAAFEKSENFEKCSFQPQIFIEMCSFWARFYIEKCILRHDGISKFGISMVAHCQKWTIFPPFCYLFGIFAPKIILEFINHQQNQSKNEENH